LRLFEGSFRRLRDDEDFWARTRELFIPFGRFGDELAVVIARDDLESGDRRQLAGLADGAPCALELALFFERLEQALERDPVAAFDAEGARDLTFAHFPGAVLDEVDELVGRRQIGEK
jgi:hypothetical protein